MEPKWQCSLEWVSQPAHLVEQYSEPGFQLACIYHPDVCQGPRLLVTEHHVLALYGNLYDEDLHAAYGEALCRALLDRFVQGGANRLRHLNGRYDIAIWDRHDKVLSFISDRFGANRHYALQRPGALHLACEVKAVAGFMDQIEIDPAGLASLLSFGYNLGELTLLRGVKCLPQARHIEFHRTTDTFRMERYWNYPYGELETRSASAAELAEELHQHLSRALKRRLRKIEKILLPMSGGLDSRTMAGLLAQSDFSGEVLSYSYGQTSSRDVRYGRAIARKLGYRHIHIPTPVDFMTQHLEQAAWRFDAEWPADSNWGARFSHTHPILGDLRGYTVLSGFMGDIILGSDRYHYRHKSGDLPLGAEQLAAIFFACVRDMPVDGLFEPLSADEAENGIAAIAKETFEPLQSIVPFFALLRSEFLHRQRRHTATITQSVEYDLKAITPFLDRDVVDFSMRIPLALHHDKVLYKHMIHNHLPEVAAIPCASTGLPLAEAPLRQALKWRTDRLMKYFPAWQRRLKRRNDFFDFRGGVLAQSNYFNEHIPLLAGLSPPLRDGAPEQRMTDLLHGKIKATEQASALLPPACYVRALELALDSRR
jgi:asparagine synthetase B (glutamine-hydrolysing)